MRRRIELLVHRGSAVDCPVCGGRFDRFKDDWNRPDALCWSCGSHERHRAQWLLLEGRAELLERAGSLLHFAPEWALRRRLSARAGLRYVTADLEQPDVDLKLDITAIALPDESFDAVICSHVLEHVKDDRAAMRELRRITAPGGWCLVMVPLDLRRTRTFEDPAITSPQDRERAFWQHDHLRLYAADIGERLQRAGFTVEQITPADEFGAETMTRCRIGESEHLWLCRRAPARTVPATGPPAALGAGRLSPRRRVPSVGSVPASPPLRPMNLRDRLSASRTISPSSPGRSAGGSDAVEALRDSWSSYPSEWKQDASLNLGANVLGEEWGGPAFADFIVDSVSPFLGAEVDVLELGCGGGKFSRRIAPRCRSLVCTDISEAMIEHTRAGVQEAGVAGSVSYRVLNGVDFTGVAPGSVDFIFSYDVQLHLQPQNVFSYLLDARRVLRDGGVFMLHQVNLATEGGVGHFLGQFGANTWKYAFDDPRRRGHIYFMSEDQMVALAGQAGLSVDRIVHDSEAFRHVTGGRDLIGFMRKLPSRLTGRDAASLPLVKARGDHVVYAVLDGRRFGITSAIQFERDGFRWQDVREVDAEELGAIPDGGLLEPWE
ncbi:MAG: methyltransferase domain-containing protein [Solirubrobacteraceae bacterium]